MREVNETLSAEKVARARVERMLAAARERTQEVESRALMLAAVVESELAQRHKAEQELKAQLGQVEAKLVTTEEELQYTAQELANLIEAKGLWRRRWMQ